MFSIQRRDRLRDQLVAAARDDERIQGAALTGSGSVDKTDAWSDIDLCLGLLPDTDQAEVLTDWTQRMYREHGVVHHTDVVFRNTVYRVFLLADTLQVDIAFSPDGEFGATSSTFRLLFGTASPQAPAPEPDSQAVVGMAWLHGLHVRSSLARNKLWQVDYMLSGMRNQVLALACLRHGLPAQQCRGVDRLPSGAVDPAMIPASLTAEALSRAFVRTTEALLREVDELDPSLAARLRPCLHDLVGHPAAGHNPSGAQTVDNG